MLYVFNTCKHFIRTIPALIYSETQVEDVDTKMEDHIYDEWRYMCMARPIKARKKGSPAEILDYKNTDDPLNLVMDKQLSAGFKRVF